MNMYFDNLFNIKVEGQGYSFCVFLVCMLLSETVRLDSDNDIC